MPARGNPIESQSFAYCFVATRVCRSGSYRVTDATTDAMCIRDVVFYLLHASLIIHLSRFCVVTVPSGTRPDRGGSRVSPRPVGSAVAAVRRLARTSQ